MKKVLYFSALVVLLASSPSNAGSSRGLVSLVFAHSPDVLMFEAGTISNPATCNRTNQWAISMSDPIGKPMLAILLAAQAQGKEVYVYGYSQSCSAWGDREMPSYIVIIN